MTRHVNGENRLVDVEVVISMTILPGSEVFQGMKLRQTVYTIK